MVAKIGRSGNLYGALAYDQPKVEKEKGQVLLTDKIIETSNGHQRGCIEPKVTIWE